ncbi:hypothetical protein Dsin_023603 [Dipteronia sinensis]|uniref:SWIM-type domain-containing protein n=1 Tax=Dipteronia sinensis TaxID=43782 RepID=A0AAE0A3L3_9ROSI|nr:hypothetical protein Dsin_023603 [Dipteronia sinensis]
MVGARKNSEDQLQYDPDDPENYFSFMVHHGGEFCGELDNNIGGTINFFDFVSLEELSLLDMDEIAIKLGVVDLYLEPIVPLQEVKWDELISSQQPESQYHRFGEASDANEAEADNNNGAKNDAEEHRHVGDEHMPTDHGPAGDEHGLMLLMSIGLLIMGLMVPNLPREECADGYDIDDISDELRNLEGSDGEEVEGGPIRKFISISYHEFNPTRDMQDPVFKVGMEFGSVDIFRKAVRAHAVKQMRNVKFAKNDPNRVRAVCKFVKKVKQDSCFCYPVYSGNYKYQVTGRGEDQFVVDIDKKTCACKKWQLIGIPCIHGMTALLSSNRDHIDFIDNKYKKATFLKAYTTVIYGINGPSMWPKTNDTPMQCPDFKKQRGKPKKARTL